MRYPNTILWKRHIQIVAAVLLFSIWTAESLAEPSRSPSHSARLEMANAAAADLITHFWVGTAEAGHAADTHNGYPVKAGERGEIWERAVLICDMANLYSQTHNPDLKRRVAADWRYVQHMYTLNEIQNCGAGSPSYAQDDATWGVLMLLDIHRTCGDQTALYAAAGLYKNCIKRWQAEDGGLYYNDKREIKSSYQAPLIAAGLRLYEALHDEAYRTWALQIYAYCEANMLRGDGLYWCDLHREQQALQPSIPAEASSDTFLAGNMAMGAAHALFYRLTHQPIYLERALRTVRGIGKAESCGGCYLDDRDAWTNGFAMQMWAEDVLTVRQLAADAREQMVQTAVSIHELARTPAGYYGGSWCGPATGSGSRWWQAGSRPEQIMTSASAAAVLIAAASLK